MIYTVYFNDETFLALEATDVQNAVYNANKYCWHKFGFIKTIDLIKYETPLNIWGRIINWILYLFQI